MLTALLSWYDEEPAWLTRAILSLRLLPVERLVAIDGAYGLFPAGKSASAPEQHEAIKDACAEIGIGQTIYTPSKVWEGNEIAKRNQLFRMAEKATTENDWYLVIDADEAVIQAPHDVGLKLQQTPFDVAAVTLNEPGHPFGPLTFATFPMLFRAIRGLTVYGNHFTYMAPDGRKLWGDAKRDRLEPRADLTGIVVEHYKEFRHPDRKQAAMGYYRSRDERGVEELSPDRNLLAA